MGQWWVSWSCSRCGPGGDAEEDCPVSEQVNGREEKVVEKCRRRGRKEERERQIGIERVKGVGKKQKEKRRGEVCRREELEM